MAAREQEPPKFYTFVRTHSTAFGFLLLLIAFGAMALDYFHSDLLGPRLLYLRLIYAVLALLVIGYVYIVSIMSEGPKSK